MSLGPEIHLPPTDRDLQMTYCQDSGKFEFKGSVNLHVKKKKKTSLFAFTLTAKLAFPSIMDVGNKQNL